MAQVKVDVALKNFQAPAGTVQGKYKFSVTSPSGQTGLSDQLEDSPSSTFSNVADGDYVATVQALDSNGGNLGDPAQVSFTVSTPATVTVSVADAVTVTITP